MNAGERTISSGSLRYAKRENRSTEGGTVAAKARSLALFPVAWIGKGVSDGRECQSTSLRRRLGRGGMEVTLCGFGSAAPEPEAEERGRQTEGGT
jgi:hypothetical protein